MTWTAFEKMLRARFEPINANQMARSQLRHFKQKYTVADYTANFLGIASAIDNLSHAEMCDRYLAGLKQEIADAVALQPLPEGDFNALVAAAERIDAVRNQQRRGKFFELWPNSKFHHPWRQVLDPSCSNSVELDFMTSSKQDKPLAKTWPNSKHWSCLFCGMNGHRLKQCHGFFHYRSLYKKEQKENPRPKNVSHQ